MRKIINNRPCVRYGDAPTHLALSEKSQHLYDTTDPIDIYEAVLSDPDDLHEIYGYAFSFCREPIRPCWPDKREWLTEDELNAALEEIADDIAESVFGEDEDEEE